MVSLCQFPLFAVGAWTALRFENLPGTMPFPVLLLVAGVVTGLIGVLVGLPALRLSGLYLALITLMAAGALTVALGRAQFPNGGSGFFASDRAGGSVSQLPRPSIASGDTAFYRYCVIVALLMFLLALVHVVGKPGRAWAAIRQSQVTAVAAGVNTTLYKLWCFALASFVTGVAGALLAAAPGGVSTSQFSIDKSIVLLAVTFMGGIYTLWGAVVGALLLRLLPELLDDWGIGIEVLTILFGVGIIQVLMTAPGGLVEQVPKDLANLGRKIGGLFSRPTDAPGTRS
jgi:branched-chain amino acid transport system permease protein